MESFASLLCCWIACPVEAAVLEIEGAAALTKVDGLERLDATESLADVSPTRSRGEVSYAGDANDWDGEPWAGTSSEVCYIFNYFTAGKGTPLSRLTTPLTLMCDGVESRAGRNVTRIFRSLIASRDSFSIPDHCS